MLRPLCALLILLPLWLTAQHGYEDQVAAVESLISAGNYAAARAQAKALVQTGKESKQAAVVADGYYLIGRATLMDGKTSSTEKVNAVKSLRAAALSFRQLGRSDMVDSITHVIEGIKGSAPPALQPNRGATVVNDSLESASFNAIVRLQNEEIDSLNDQQVRQLIAMERQQGQLAALEMEALADSLQLKQQEQELGMQEAVIEAERLRRNILFVGGLGILMLLTLLYSRYLSSKRYQARLQAEKDRSDDLLLNILPGSVADELKDTGKATARRFEEVTVLFADFKGFSRLAATLPPEELVGLLDEAFRTFDGIVAAYGMEKIKTIGDAYMCAAGLPEPSTDHAEVAVRAAMDMQMYLEENPNFRARIGIHSGPVVAGVVGRDKFAYDIWGDTVNQAARLEAAGGVGEVTVSKTTCGLVGDTFDWEYTGTFEAKNIGEMERFRVTGVKVG